MSRVDIFPFRAFLPKQGKAGKADTPLNNKHQKIAAVAKKQFSCADFPPPLDLLGASKKLRFSGRAEQIPFTDFPPPLAQVLREGDEIPKIKNPKENLRLRRRLTRSAPQCSQSTKIVPNRSICRSKSNPQLSSCPIDELRFEMGVNLGMSDANFCARVLSDLAENAGSFEKKMILRGNDLPARAVTKCLSNAASTYLENVMSSMEKFFEGNPLPSYEFDRWDNALASNTAKESKKSKRKREKEAQIKENEEFEKFSIYSKKLFDHMLATPMDTDLRQFTRKMEEALKPHSEDPNFGSEQMICTLVLRLLIPKSIEQAASSGSIERITFAKDYAQFFISFIQDEKSGSGNSLNKLRNLLGSDAFSQTRKECRKQLFESFNREFAKR